MSQKVSQTVGQWDSKMGHLLDRLEDKMKNGGRCCKRPPCREDQAWRPSVPILITA